METIVHESYLYIIIVGLIAIAIVVRVFDLGFIQLKQPYVRHFKSVNPHGGFVEPRDKDNKYYQGKRIDVANMPPPFPNGWYVLCYSDELGVKETKYIKALGLDIAVFRGEDEKCYAIHAYCSHLGANLAIGGEVSGKCLKCPFHHWHFDGSSGKCVDIPNIETCKIPANAHLPSFNIHEENGVVLMWFDVENREPQYPPPTAPEMNEKSRCYCLGHSEHTVSCHIQEIPENGADQSHLATLHGPFITGALQSIFRHKWWSTWVVNADNSWLTDLNIHEGMEILGNELIPAFDVHVSGHQHGPSVVILRYHTIFGPIVLYENILPLRPMLVRARHTVYAGPFVPRILASAFLRSAIVQFERDVPIWSSKVYKAQPVLVSTDEAIPKYRRWYSQFYSKEKSCSFEEAMRHDMMHSLDW